MPTALGWLVGAVGIEPPASAVLQRRSTNELHAPCQEPWPPRETAKVSPIRIE